MIWWLHEGRKLVCMFECVYFVPQTQTKIVAVNKYFEKWRSGNMLLSRDLKRPHFLRIT